MSISLTKIARIAVALSLLLLQTPGHAAELQQPTAVIGRFYDTLLGVMKQADALGFQGRYEKLRPAIEATFDLPLMTRLSIGPQWRKLAPDQQNQLVAAFKDYTFSTYANRFDGYSGERFEINPATSAAAGGVVVQSNLVKSDGEKVSINYLMRQESGSWRVIDVFLKGTVSELATRRAEFTSVLRRDGADGLLRLLASKVAQLKEP
jgi:phospholipid transport system substrate-binding protein